MKNSKRRESGGAGPASATRAVPKRARWSTGVLAIAMFAAGCSILPPATRAPAERSRDVAGLSAVLDLIREMHIEAYRRDEHCENMAYARGAFSTAPKGSECNIFVEPPKPFDDQAHADFGAVSEALATEAVRVQRINEVTFDRVGNVTTATFDFGDNAFVGQSYVYELGAAPPDSVDGNTVTTHIDNDWSMVVDPVN